MGQTIRGRVMEYNIARAKEMLQVAADYIRKHYPDGMIHYDGADCDGYCVADDCEIASASLDDGSN